jgi:hypothetical protein
MKTTKGLVLLVMVLALAFAGTTTGAASTRVSARRPATSHVPNSVQAPPRTWLRTLARVFVTWKERHGEVATEIGEELFKEWLREEKCSNLLPAPFFCPPRPSIWGVGFALSWHGRSPGVWTSPNSPRQLVRLRNGATYGLTPGVLYWLTCYVRGDRVTDGGIATNLWYRLPSRGWVNDGWVNTGTNYPIPGVRRC